MSNYSVGNVGLYDYSALLNNPYLMYNPYFTNMGNVSFMGQTQSNSTQATTSPTTAQNLASKGATQKEKKGNGAAKFIIGTALTVGASVLCRKAYVKGGGQGWFSKDFLSKTKNGFVEMFREVKGKFPQLTERFTIDGDNLCTLPGQVNKLEGSKMVDNIRKLGGVVDVPNLADDGVEILEATYQINKRSSVTFKDGKIFSFINSKGKSIPVSEMTQAEKNRVTTILNRIKNKDATTLDSLTKVAYSKTQNNVTSYFAKGYSAVDDGITDGLQYGLTKKFHLDSDDVKVYLKEHEQVKKALQEYLDGNAKNLKYAYAEYPVSGVGTLRIENGKVSGIEILEDGVKNFYSTDSVKFKAQDLEETVRKIFDHTADFVNPRYAF